MAAGPSRQWGPVACEPGREEQTSLPSVSHQNRMQLHVYPKHRLPDSAVRGPGTTVSNTVVSLVVVALLGGGQGFTCLAVFWYGTGVQVRGLCLAPLAISNPTKEGTWLTRSSKSRMQLDLVSKSPFPGRCFPLLTIHIKQ